MSPLDILDPVEIPSATIAATRFEKLERAWNRGDGAGYAAVFAADADFVNIRGEHHVGREAIARGHQGIFDTIYAGSSVHYDVRSARLVGPGCIVALADATLQVPAGPLPGEIHARITALVVQHRGRWLLGSFHNTLVLESP